MNFFTCSCKGICARRREIKLVCEVIKYQLNSTFQKLTRTILYRKTIVVGAGYIAVEMAGILNALGSKTRLVIRRHQALRNFDSMLSENVTYEMMSAGISIDKFSKVSRAFYSPFLFTCTPCYVRLEYVLTKSPLYEN